jgi:hypothetical protein
MKRASPVVASYHDDQPGIGAGPKRSEGTGGQSSVSDGGMWLRRWSVSSGLVLQRQDGAHDSAERGLGRHTGIEPAATTGRFWSRATLGLGCYLVQGAGDCWQRWETRHSRVCNLQSTWSDRVRIPPLTFARSYRRRCLQARRDSPAAHREWARISPSASSACARSGSHGELRRDGSPTRMRSRRSAQREGGRIPPSPPRLKS